MIKSSTGIQTITRCMCFQFHFVPASRLDGRAEGVLNLGEGVAGGVRGTAVHELLSCRCCA
jgi:hypothetical protein